MGKEVREDGGYANSVLLLRRPQSDIVVFKRARDDEVSCLHCNDIHVTGGGDGGDVRAESVRSGPSAFFFYIPTKQNLLSTIKYELTIEFLSAVG